MPVRTPSSYCSELASGWTASKMQVKAGGWGGGGSLQGKGM